MATERWIPGSACGGPGMTNSSLRDRLRLAQTLDQRRAQQERPRSHRVVRGATQLVLILLTHLRIGLGEQALVADGLGLRVLDRDVAALALVAVEHVLVGLAAQNRGELVGEVKGVMHATVHAHRADRAVHMGGIAGEDRAAGAETLL